jgi:membrane-associated phospholipid phosphatase
MTAADAQAGARQTMAQTIRGPGRRTLFACAAVFLAAVVDVALDGPLSQLDRWAAKWAGSNLGSAGQDAALLLTRLGDDPVLVGIIVLAAGACLLLGSAWNALLAASVGLFERLLVYTLKSIWHRARPDELVLTYAFPSGHASGTACAYGLLVLLVVASLQRRGQDAPWAIWAMGAWIGLVLVVAATRIILGLHWVTDVLAGAAIGFGLAAAANLAARRAPPDPANEIVAAA